MAIARASQTEQDIDNVGFLRRRALRIKRLGIVALGRTVLRPAKPASTKAGEVREARSCAEQHREHRATVLREIEIIEGRVGELDARIASTMPDVDTPELAEARAERRMACQLRGDLIAEMDSPITVDRDARPVDERMRKIIARMAKARAELNWEAAERHAAAGDYREARLRRVNAFRGRHIAEYELGLRASLPGFTSPWT